MTIEQLNVLAAEADAALAERYAKIDAISQVNTEKVLDSFRKHRVSEAMFMPSSGYGYDDKGRDTLDAIMPMCSVQKLHSCATTLSTAPRPVTVASLMPSTAASHKTFSTISSPGSRRIT